MYAELAKEKSLCILLPFIEETLEKAGRKIMPSNFKKILGDFLSAISHLQQHKIVHRDIKPDNVLFDTHLEKIVLIDFGMSYCCKNHQLQFDYQPGLLKWGNEKFQPPEVFTAKEETTIDYSKSDLWAACATLYNIICTTSSFGNNFNVNNLSRLPKEFSKFQKFFDCVLHHDFNLRPNLQQAIQELQKL